MTQRSFVRWKKPFVCGLNSKIMTGRSVLSREISQPDLEWIWKNFTDLVERTLRIVRASYSYQLPMESDAIFSDDVSDFMASIKLPPSSTMTLTNHIHPKLEENNQDMHWCTTICHIGFTRVNWDSLLSYWLECALVICGWQPMPFNIRLLSFFPTQ